MLKPPAKGSSLPGSRSLPKNVRSILEKGIADAVSQILARNYIRPFQSKRPTRVCAVSVYGWSYCMFRFYNVDWNAKTVQEPVPKNHPE
jgi:hypothetical protein